MVLDHLAGQGIDTKPYTDRLGRSLSITLGDPPKMLPPRLHRWWLYRRLADVAALEHFTAMLGQWVLQNRTLDDARRRPDDARPAALARRRRGRTPLAGLRRLPTCQRQLRHQSLLDADDRATVHRLVVAGARYLMATDPTIDQKWRWRDWVRAARRDRLPGPWTLLVTSPLRYLRPSNHPSREASTQMAVDYLEYSPAARAARERASARQRPQGAGDDQRLAGTRRGKRCSTMKVAVDLDTCDGNGVCMSICHEVFDVQEDGLHVLDAHRATTAPPAQRRRRSCPTQAITVED